MNPTVRTRTRIFSVVSALAVVTAVGWSCDGGKTTTTSKKTSLADARKGHVTKLTRTVRGFAPAEPPPKETFQLVRYTSPAGKMQAYVSRPPGDGQLRPAIIWLFGGFGNDIGDTAWTYAEPNNDQSASALWRAGIITMYPSLRGGNSNPGNVESFYGEVDDVLAATDWLAKQKGVDPTRIYLGGHSTGGTLALLVAECSNRFRAVFACGAVDEITTYGKKNLVFDVTNKQEAELRSPIHWLDAISSPVFVFEGETQGNVICLRAMKQATDNPAVRFCTVPSADHFSILKPLHKALAERILADTGPTTNIEFTKDDVENLMERY